MLDLYNMQQKAVKKHINEFGQINAIKANNNAALKDLYQDNYYRIEKYVVNNNGSKEDAKDIYQDAFIAVWRNIQLDKFYPENENALAGYLYRIAKNKWLDYLRSGHFKKTVTLTESVDEREDDELPEEDQKYISEVKKHFEQLGENCKEVLKRYYYEKESMKTIAAKFDWTESYARTHKYRCLQRLRELLKK